MSAQTFSQRLVAAHAPLTPAKLLERFWPIGMAVEYKDLPPTLQLKYARQHMRREELRYRGFTWMR